MNNGKKANMKIKNFKTIGEIETQIENFYELSFDSTEEVNIKCTEGQNNKIQELLLKPFSKPLELIIDSNFDSTIDSKKVQFNFSSFYMTKFPSVKVKINILQRMQNLH